MNAPATRDYSERAIGWRRWRRSVKRGNRCSEENRYPAVGLGCCIPTQTYSEPTEQHTKTRARLTPPNPAERTANALVIVAIRSQTGTVGLGCVRLPSYPDQRYRSTVNVVTMRCSHDGGGFVIPSGSDVT